MTYSLDLKNRVLSFPLLKRDTQKEIADFFQVRISAVFYALRRLKLTYKKNIFLPRAGRKQTGKIS